MPPSHQASMMANPISGGSPNPTDKPTDGTSDPVRAYLHQLPDWRHEQRAHALCSRLSRHNPTASADKRRFWTSVLRKCVREGWLADSSTSSSNASSSTEPSAAGGGADAASRVSLRLAPSPSSAGKSSVSRHQSGSKNSLSSSHGSASASLDVLCAGVERRFERNGLTPKCLGQVLDQMARDGELLDATALMRCHRGADNNSAQSGWPGMAWSWLVVKPATALFGLAQSYYQSTGSSASSLAHDGPAVLTAGRWVFADLLQERADAVIAAHKRACLYYADTLMTLEEFQQKYQVESQLDARLIVHWLCGRGLACIEVVSMGDGINSSSGGNSEAVDAQKTLVKLARDGQQPPIDWLEQDRGILQLRSSLSTLSRHIARLQQQSLTLRQQAQQYLKQNQKSLALRYLRQQKAVDKVLEQRVDSAHTLEQIYMRIQHADTEAEIVDAYRVGTRTLQQQRAQHPDQLTAEGVQRTMDALEDVLADYAETDAALKDGQARIEQQQMEQLSTAGVGVGEDVEAELERELDALLQQQTEKQQTEKQQTEKIEVDTISADNKKTAEEMRELARQLAATQLLDGLPIAVPQSNPSGAAVSERKNKNDDASSKLMIPEQS